MNVGFRPSCARGRSPRATAATEIDLTPATTTTDRLLDPGQSFTDSMIGLTITTLSSDSTGAVIGVSFGGATPTCTRANQTVRLTSTQSQAVAAGTIVAYTASIKSNDSAACTAAAFNLAATVPGGWTATLASPSLTLTPGSSGTTTLQVTSMSTAMAGSYTVSAWATNGQDTTKSGSGSAVYSVNAPVTPLTMIVATDQASYSTSSFIRLTATVITGTTWASGASVTFKITRPDGRTVTSTATTGTSGTATVSLRVKNNDPRGTHQESSTANLNGSSASATTSYTVQ